MQICVNNVCKRYKRKRGEKGFINNLKALFNSNYEYIDAIKGVSFNLDKGEIVGYIGANGSGKSTTIKMLCGIFTPDSGEITVDGRNVDIRDRSFKKNIGAVFGQRSNLWNDLPASDTFSLFKYIYEISEEEFEKNYRFIDGFLNVSSIENVAVRKLSLGQRMKCEICAAMLHFPDILFLDEPTIGLDINIRKSVMALMKEYNIKFNKTIIITSHNVVINRKAVFWKFSAAKGLCIWGQFDLILLKPAHPLLYMTLMDFNGIHIAQTIIAGMIVGYSFVYLNIVFCIRNILFIIISVVYGVLLLGAMTIFTTSIFFYTEGTFSLFNIIELFKEYAKYPISIFGKGALLMFPMGMISYFPTELLLAGNGKSIILYMILGGIVSIIIYILSNKFFDYSAKKYQSTGG